ncbi:MAG: ribonuclease [Saprospiraceae bacterium]|nr:ribonuclease [Saprospiraceae bacterium]MBK6566070.1 ribonuclease [Saprospiraceae bacterium]MBK6784349.1 ribonuclease [Saprospiraceae bacterium]MBK7525757.1 ribonuclease [Saprospiraceae bacterium]MBK8369912.1 ribonuclease [Saprospiraceae bacterium]
MSKSTTEVSKDKYHTNKTSKNLSPEIPDYVMEVLSYVQQNNQPLKGYVGGRRFFNREKKLPEQDNSGNKISYREWDVHPKKPNKNRGPERMVTSSNNKAYYTKNHYKDFIEIK